MFKNSVTALAYDAYNYRYAAHNNFLEVVNEEFFRHPVHFSPGEAGEEVAKSDLTTLTSQVVSIHSIHIYNSTAARG